MPAEDIAPPTMSQPTTNTAITTASIPPTYHMNTDSHTGKRNCPASPVADTNHTSNQTNRKVQKQTSASSAPANKHLNIKQPPQSPAAQHQWDFLRLGTTTMAEILVNGVRTLDSSFRITATSPGGFHTPQLGQLTWGNVSQVLKERWPQKEGAKAWVHTYWAKHESNAQSMV
ncbi:uncharacterized protein BJ212DRAFT_1480079 [Suillus subaureus]|uniref:Uncharacterized protein n=1 Tax=Suillus subaureus TaxID=48587 RepID=A0A9P7JE91_9AGAM|nr:uncharacterized protein BJ212DRAFT_1480079 [Suillus subaureus]KAG1817508.1 hypothetical protein BJ212DRAFT_1480079 [Suillus subaureus]